MPEIKKLKLTLNLINDLDLTKKSEFILFLNFINLISNLALLAFLLLLLISSMLLSLFMITGSPIEGSTLIIFSIEVYGVAI